MSLFNFGKEKIPTPIKSIDKEIIEDQEREFGSLSDPEILEQKELLLKLAKSSSNEPIVVENTRVVKESEEDKNEKIRKNREFLGI